MLDQISSVAGSDLAEWEPGRLVSSFCPWANTVFGNATRLIRTISDSSGPETLKNPVTRVYIRLRWGAK
jgi:hypothetical protein